MQGRTRPRSPGKRTGTGRGLLDQQGRLPASAAGQVKGAPAVPSKEASERSSKQTPSIRPGPIVRSIFRLLWERRSRTWRRRLGAFHIRSRPLGESSGEARSGQGR